MLFEQLFFECFFSFSIILMLKILRYSGLNSPDYLSKIGLKNMSIATGEKDPNQGFLFIDFF